MKARIFGIFMLFVVLCVFMIVMTLSDKTGSTFLKLNNIENLVSRTSMYGILGVGVVFVIITSGIDLSIGSVVCLSGCFLGLFLHVDYQEYNSHPVRKVLAEEKKIVVNGHTLSFKSGDRIRYSDGVRANNAMLTITRVVEDGESTVIHVDQVLSADDTSGKIVRAYSVTEFDVGDADNEDQPVPPSITVAGDHGYLRYRDQVILVNPTGTKRKRLPINEVQVRGNETFVTLSNDLGKNFTTEWLAIPVERRQRMPILVALASVCAIAIGLGLIHGLLVTKMNQQPFIITLCGLLIYRGLSRWLVNDQPVGFGSEYKDTLTPLGDGKLELMQFEHGITIGIRMPFGDGLLEMVQIPAGSTFGIPYPFMVLIAVVIAAAVFLNKTIWGRYLLALGRNKDAARYSGINTDRVTLMAYAISTTLAAVGGILFALNSNSISPSSFGNFYELFAIAAAVLGGCSLRGGEGSILGVIIGTAVLQVLYNLVNLMKISDTLQFAIIGTVILIGVLADEVIRRIAAKRRARAQARK